MWVEGLGSCLKRLGRLTGNEGSAGEGESRSGSLTHGRAEGLN